MGDGNGRVLGEVREELLDVGDGRAAADGDAGGAGNHIDLRILAVPFEGGGREDGELLGCLEVARSAVAVPLEQNAAGKDRPDVDIIAEGPADEAEKSAGRGVGEQSDELDNVRVGVVGNLRRGLLVSRDLGSLSSWRDVGTANHCEDLCFAVVRDDAN